MSIVIRQAVPEDASTLARMRWDDSIESGTSATQQFSEFESTFVEFVRAAIADDEWVIWIAEVDERVVSHVYVQSVLMVPRPGRFARRWGYVAAAYTVPAARNQGIGSRLLGSVIDWARAEQMEFLLLGVSDRSVSLYERAGFVRSPDTMELRLDL